MNGPAFWRRRNGRDRLISVPRYLKFCPTAWSEGYDDGSDSSSSDSSTSSSESSGDSGGGRRLMPKTRRYISASVIYRNDACLDSFQYFHGVSLELLENAAFPFASRRALKYR